MKSMSATRKVGPKKPVMISRGPSINATNKAKQKNNQLIDNSSMDDMIL